MQLDRYGVFKPNGDRILVPFLPDHEGPVHNITGERGNVSADRRVEENQSRFLKQTIASVGSRAAFGSVKIRWLKMHNYRAVPPFDLGDRRIMEFHYGVHFDERYSNLSLCARLIGLAKQGRDGAGILEPKKAGVALKNDVTTSTLILIPEHTDQLLAGERLDSPTEYHVNDNRSAIRDRVENSPVKAPNDQEKHGP
jgi:hypothetical protein